MIINKSELYNCKIENFIFKFKDKFDIFFLDPPFTDDYFIKNLEYLNLKKSLIKYIIIHRKKVSG